MQTLTLTPFSKKSIAERKSRRLTVDKPLHRYFINLLASLFGDLGGVNESRMVAVFCSSDSHSEGKGNFGRASDFRLLLLIGRRIASARRAKSEICNRLSPSAVGFLKVQCVTHKEIYGMK